MDKQTKQEVRDGESISYYRNGKIKSQGLYEAGLKVGAWVEYHENGIKRSEEYYKVGLADSTWAIYNEAGLCEYFQTYENGFLIGLEGQQTEDQSSVSTGEGGRIRLYFDSFETEEGYDYLSLYFQGSRIVSFSGELGSGWSEWYTLSGNTDELLFVFNSDETTVDRGFSISRLEFQSESGDIQEDIIVNITDGPGDYRSYEEMTWRVPVPRMDLSLNFQVVRDPSNNKPVKHGLYKASYPDGGFFEIGHYHNGHKNGEWKGYYEDGTLRYVECWHLQSDSRSVLDGISTYYYPEGTKHREYNYADGLLNGEYVEYYADGTFRYKGEYANGKLTGAFKRFYDDGRLQDVTTYSSGDFESKFVYQYDDKKIKRRAFTYTEDDVLDGLAQYYDSLSGARVVAEGNFKNGVPWDGTFENYAIPGQANIQEYREGERWSGVWATDTMSSLVVYDDVLLNTDFVIFPDEDYQFYYLYVDLFSLNTGTGMDAFVNGNTYPSVNTISHRYSDWWTYWLEQTVANTRTIRQATLSYEDGKLIRALYYGSGWAAEAHYIDGILDGEWKVWWPNEAESDELESVPVMETGMFEAGRPVGSWSGQYSDGQPAFAAEFDDSGQLSTMEVYYRSGNVLVRRSFESDTVTLYEDSAGEPLIVSGGIADDDFTRLGTWTYYGEDGSAAFQETYDASGVRVTTGLEGIWSSDLLSLELDATSAISDGSSIGEEWTEFRLDFYDFCIEKDLDFFVLYNDNSNRVWGLHGCREENDYPDGWITPWRSLPPGSRNLSAVLETNGTGTRRGFELQEIQFRNSSDDGQWLTWNVTDGNGNYANNLGEVLRNVTFELPHPVVGIKKEHASWRFDIAPISYDSPSYRRFVLRLGDDDIFYVVDINGDTIQLEDDITLIRSSAAGKMAVSVQPAPYRSQNIEFVSGNALQVNSPKVKRRAIND